MNPPPDDDDLHLLRALRVRGHATVDELAHRFEASSPTILDHLLDHEARGRVVRTRFAGHNSWSLTEAGKTHGEGLLAAELDSHDARPIVEQVYQRFLPLNAQVAHACTQYQLTVLGIDGTTAASAIAQLREPARELVHLEDCLVAHLPRFRGYAARFATALSRAETEPEWITAMDRDSCHRTWFELHEDLIATLGLQRT